MAEGNNQEVHPNVLAIQQVLGDLAGGLRYATAGNGNVNMQPATLKGDKMTDVLQPFMSAAQHLIDEGMIQSSDIRISAARVITQEDVGETIFESKLSIWWNKEEYRQGYNTNAAEVESKLEAFQSRLEQLTNLLMEKGVSQSDLDALENKTEDEMPQIPNKVEIPC